MVYFANATLRFDGACQPNPGEGGAGYVIFNDKNGNHILEGRYYIGWRFDDYEEYYGQHYGQDCTNNIAEYYGLIKGLEALNESRHTIGHLSIEGDSKLVINQMDDNWNVNSDMLLPLYNRGKDLVRMCTNNNSFNSYWYKHIYRENNRTADEYARDALSLNKVVLLI